MGYSIIDTHSHLYFPSFDKDRDSVVENCNNVDVKFQIQIGCDEVSSLCALELTKKYSNFYSTVGLHPTDVFSAFKNNKEYRSANYEDYNIQSKNINELIMFFEVLIKNNREKIVGIGETGFDLYHENTKEIYEEQKKSFSMHIDLARKFDLPVIIHIRNAKNVFEEFLKENFKNKPFKAVVHCFSEDTAFANKMVKEYGFLLGIGGVATYPKSIEIRKAIKETPIEYLLTETDAPFLVPQNARKEGIKRNDASFIPEIIKTIAKEKECEEKECGEILFQNAKKFFRI